MTTTPDFRTLQIQTNKIIPSGSTGTNAKLLIYPIDAEDSSTPNRGIIDQAIFATSSIGNDVFIFISGAKNSIDSSVAGSVVFGGDALVSGSASVKGNLTSSNIANDGTRLIIGSNPIGEVHSRYPQMAFMGQESGGTAGFYVSESNDSFYMFVSQRSFNIEALPEEGSFCPIIMSSSVDNSSLEAFKIHAATGKLNIVSGDSTNIRAGAQLVLSSSDSILLDYDDDTSSITLNADLDIDVSESLLIDVGDEAELVFGKYFSLTATPYIQINIESAGLYLSSSGNDFYMNNTTSGSIICVTSSLFCVKGTAWTPTYNLIAASSVEMNFALSNTFFLGLDQHLTMSNPINAQSGSTGLLEISSSGDYGIEWGSNFFKASGESLDPSGDGLLDVFSWLCGSENRIYISRLANFVSASS